MRVAILLRKLELEADAMFKTEWKGRNQEIVRHNARPPVTPPSKADQSRSQLLRLRKKTVEIDNELQLEQQVENHFSDTSKLARGGIVDTKPMQFEDAQLVSVGQSDSEYALGIGETMDDAPTMGMYAT
jgi:hypothetical protein